MCNFRGRLSKCNDISKAQKESSLITGKNWLYKNKYKSKTKVKSVEEIQRVDFFSLYKINSVNKIK